MTPLAGSRSTLRSARQTAVEAGLRYQPLVPVLAAVAVGMGGDRAGGWPVTGWLTAAFLSGCLWLALFVRGRNRHASWWLLAALAALGGARHHVSWYSLAADDLGTFARLESQPIAIEAEVLVAPRLMPARQSQAFDVLGHKERSRVLLAAYAVRDGRTWRPASGCATLWIDGLLPNVHAGDRIRVFGRVAAPAPRMNPAGFDAAAHQRADRQWATLRAEGPDSVAVINRGSPWRPRRWLDETRRVGVRLLAEHLDPRHAELASALLLGAREQLDPRDTETFLVTGTIHLLSVSGLHVGILAALVLLLERVGLLGGAAASAWAIALTIGYAVLADAEAPVVRAATLVVVLCAARLLGREALALNSLAFSALIVLLLSPADLFRIGPQLSFLSTWALGWAALGWLRREVPHDPLDRLLASAHPAWWRSARRAILAAVHLTRLSLVVWLVTLPIVWSEFHVVSPAAVVLGTLLWLPVTLLMWSGFALLATGWLWEPWARGLACLCNLGLWMVDRTVALAAETPGSFVWLPGPPRWWVAVFYAGLFAVCVVPALRRRRRSALLLASLWFMVSASIALFLPRSGEFRTTILAVGHGSATVIEWPDGRVWVYDCGSLASPHRAADAVAGTLWTSRHRRIDLLIISHADTDHFNGVPRWLDRFQVDQVLVGPTFVTSESPAVTELVSALDRRGIPLEVVSEGAALSVPIGGEARILHPPAAGIEGSDNAHSLVLVVGWQGQQMILPGDLESPGLERLLRTEKHDAVLLVAPHHGSVRSDVPGMAGWCSPEHVVISGGFHADVPQVRSAYTARGARVWHTSQCGAVTLRVSADGRSVVTSFRSSEHGQSGK